ncbi:2,3-bisphosphoglycerate-independent phosphoglycerate mutase [Clostridium aminobutyricum]|uniref:2,3-bisphosphoglycerate-independent phosphoglycerate mutase n=1 Tax=Clostridium aminobutyricum TaxID=33953 RepID=A0A939D6J1_CLOAM|nr:2,3-bisphosphoglycerate-independent phosphoglycerate mutase [Clostridium aminobutyricum]MBN7771961.1 2,3-bisphosphoglycerate-independent phosphoglycerate mutase [Clostridium aminobutyricum]
MNKFARPTMLMILDGFGINKNTHGNAIAAAHKPHLDKIFDTYPHTTLKACGLDVGLPEGQMGNSEVGHLNIGAGRIVYQELTKITKAIKEGSFFENAALNQAMDHALSHGSALHLLGLLSDGGVHSHIGHLLALLDMAKNKGITQVYIHGLLDGRDVPPQCTLIYIALLEAHINQLGLGKLATIAGRYYGMDRDNRWERVVKAYDAIALGEGLYADSATLAVQAAYQRGENDEFVTPTVIAETRPVQDNDAVIMFNFRPDRAREITRAFVSENFDGFERKKTIQNLCYVCMTQYDAEMPNVLVAFPPQSLDNTLGEYLSELNLKQLRIAETEKYAHVTFFFNGGIEAPNKGEDRILVPSPKVATYDLQPEMSAYELTKKVIEQIQTDKYDVIILNFANADMVGHTGVFEAARKAIEALDQCVPQVVDAILAKNGQVLLTADHGNADCMLDENGCIVTAHSLNQVPLVHISKHPIPLKDGGILADLAPTLLDLMGLPIPKEMTGKSLIK